MSLRLTLIIPAVALLSCAASSADGPSGDYREVPATTVLDAPSPRPGQSAPENRDVALHGEYLVELLGCGTCHTDGALMGSPNMELALAGSRTGIAWSNPLGDKLPGVVYPPNITPDIETGIGAWSDQQIGDAIRAGIGRHADRFPHELHHQSAGRSTRRFLSRCLA